MRRAPHGARLSHLVVALALACSGCESQAADLREWRPSDHDHTEAPGRDQVDVSDGGPQNPLAAHGITDVVLVAWRQKCVRCHGTIGRGDGPQAAMYSPPNLSDEQRQTQLTDRDIGQVIRTGRGKMPSFDLPDSTIDGLVKLIRLMAMKAQPAASGSAAPPGASAPSAGAPAPPPAQTASSSARGTPKPAAPRPPASGSARPSTKSNVVAPTQRP